MSLNKRLMSSAPPAFVASENFGVVLYEGDGAAGHSINGGKFGAGAYMLSSSSSSQYIALPNGIINGVSGDISVSFWMNTTYSSTQTFILTTDITPYYSKIAINTETNGKLRLSYGNASNAENNFYTTSTNLLNGNWHHIAYTLDIANTTAKIYVNGSLETTHSTTITPALVASPTLTIGNVYRSDASAYQTNSYKGKLDQFRFFHNILSASQVSTLYAETAATVESLDPLNVDTTDTLQVLGDTSCIATYRFENDEVDLSGNYNGTGTAIQYAAGRYGQAASFNGSNSKINIGDSDNFASNKITFSFWANPGSGNSSNYHILFSNYVTGSLADGDFTIARLTNQKLEVGVSAAGSGRFYIHTSSAVFTNNTWKHYVVVVDNTQSANADKVNVYVDNVAIGFSVLDASGTVSGDLLDNTSDLFIGYWANDTTHGYNGEIDQVRIFNKAASASEVTTLYQENPLVASYRFEGNSNDDMRTYNGTDSNVTYEYGLGFTPDLVWIKERSAAESHRLFDTTRGATKRLFPNTDGAESTASDSLTSFDTGGFTVGSSAAVNQDGQDYVGWAWKANGGTTSSNTDGSITSTVQANSDAGFSIVKYTGNQSNATIGHGLGVVPEMIIAKGLYVQNWAVYHKDAGSNYWLQLNSTTAKIDEAIWQDTTPTSSVFSVNNNVVINKSSSDSIAYCFHSVEGFSKIGSYTGNGSANGPIVETGFEPAFLMVRRTDSGDGWIILDNKRNLTNPRNNSLKADEDAAEEANSAVRTTDFLSNGFQLKHSHQGMNASGGNYIYMAFAADPDTEAPTVASSFNIATYTGNNTSQSISGLGFQPNLVWIKDRSATRDHNLTDSVRGVTHPIYMTTQGELTNSTFLTSFDSDGFSLGNQAASNQNGDNFVAWNWKADDNEPTIHELVEDLDAVAVYKFEDNVNDVTSTYNGTATDITYNSSGKFNKSAIFNGSSSKVAVGNWGLTSNRDFSISMWIKGDDWSGDQYVYGQGANAGNFDAMSVFVRSNSTVYHDNRGNADSFTTSLSLSTGTWYHWLHTYRSSDGLHTLYINGSSVGTTTRALDLQSNNSGGAIGTREIAGSYYFDGEIDQFRVYQQTLTASNATTLYAETASDNDDLNLGMTYAASAQSIVSANSNAGFSIVKYDGTGSVQKIPHGLSAAPKFVILKKTSGTQNWNTGHDSVGWTKYFDGPNTTSAVATETTVWNDTAPTATVVTLGGSNNTNANGESYIMYAFHDVAGYQKFGSYTGSGTGTNKLINTGFQPDFVMFKDYSAGGSWWIQDSVRGSSISLKANGNNTESTTNYLTFESNGFRVSGDANGTSSWIYWAIKIN